MQVELMQLAEISVKYNIPLTYPQVFGTINALGDNRNLRLSPNCICCHPEQAQRVEGSSHLKNV